jgi:ribosomal protein L35
MSYKLKTNSAAKKRYFFLSIDLLIKSKIFKKEYHAMVEAKTEQMF